MRKKIFPDLRILVPALLFGMLLTACAPRNVFVLMPDAEGNVGAITVENEKGRQTLDREGQGVAVAGPGSAPSAPASVSEEKVRNWFGDALDAEPMPPAVFTLLFRSGTSDPTPESEARLPEILAAIRERDSADITVIGHSDRTGSRELNLKISLERAEAIQRILVESGVPAEHIATDSHGDGNPAVPTPDGVAEPRNRRVEVTVR
jgi:outer membrane protein OmpA-like peptidoglycan-associated protein